VGEVGLALPPESLAVILFRSAPSGKLSHIYTDLSIPSTIKFSVVAEFALRFGGGGIYAPFNETYFSLPRFVILNSFGCVASADSIAALVVLMPKVFK
jgi:hypothetical protein